MLGVVQELPQQQITIIMCRNVVINKSLQSTTCGVPQRSVLGPPLCTILAHRLLRRVILY